jgi:hypothetical protein
MPFKNPILVHDRVEEDVARGAIFVDHASPCSISSQNPSKVHPNNGYDLQIQS